MTASVIPQINLLTEEQIQYIHQRSLEILTRVGVRVDSPAAQRMFTAAEGARWLNQERVTLSPELVEWAIQSAPSVVEVYDRRGQLAFRLGEGRARFGLGVTNLYYQDPLSDDVTPFTRQHMALCTRLVNSLPLYDVVSTIGVVQDYPPETADMYATLEMISNTTRPLLLLISNEDLFPHVLKLAQRLHGELGDKPFLLPYFNPITPLIINASTADKMLEAIQHGLPVIYSNYSMAGMSTPITAAGTLVLMNAELLAGLTLAQLARPGAPIILGSLPAFFDMRAMQDFYDPHTFVINLACAEMMAHYGLPHAGTSGCGLGWGADLPAAGLLWMNHLTSLLGKVGLAPFVGGVLGSKVFSPALAVYSHEVIAQALRFAQGFPLDDTVLGVDEIAQRGPGGSFLDADLTLQLYRRAYYESMVFPRLGLEQWQARDRPRAEDLLRQRTLSLLETTSPPEDQAELIALGEAFIRGL